MKLDIAQLVIATTTDARIAGHRPTTTKPLRKCDTSSIIRPLMTSRNRPSVSRVIGKVRITRIGRTKALTIPSSSAAAIRLPVERISTPGTICEASHRPSATTAARIRNPLMNVALLLFAPI